MRNPEGNKVELVFCPQIMKELLLIDVCFDVGPQFQNIGVGFTPNLKKHSPDKFKLGLLEIVSFISHRIIKNLGEFFLF